MFSHEMSSAELDCGKTVSKMLQNSIKVTPLGIPVGDGKHQIWDNSSLESDDVKFRVVSMGDKVEV